MRWNCLIRSTIWIKWESNWIFLSTLPDEKPLLSNKLFFFRFALLLRDPKQTKANCLVTFCNHIACQDMNNYQMSVVFENRDEGEYCKDSLVGDFHPPLWAREGYKLNRINYTQMVPLIFLTSFKTRSGRVETFKFPWKVVGVVRRFIDFLLLLICFYSRH